MVGKSSAVNLYCLVVILTTITAASEYLSEKDLLEKLSEDVEILGNEQEEIKEKLNTLMKFQGIDVTEDTDFWPPLVLLNVSREEAGVLEGTPRIKYTVWYRNTGSDDDDVSVLWKIPEYYDNGGHPLEITTEGVTEGDYKIWSTSAIADWSRLSPLLLIIKRMDIMLSYNIVLNGYDDYEDSNRTRTIDGVDIVQVLNDGDIVYGEGEDPIIKLRTHYVTRDPYDTTAASVFVDYINVMTYHRLKKYCYFDTENESCQALPGKKFRDDMEYQIQISSREDGARPSGFITLKVNMKRDYIWSPDSEPELFRIDISTQQSVVIRPQSQAGPYPDDFMEVKFNPNYELQSAISCRYMDDVCPLSCGVRGNDLQEVKIVKQLPDGTTEELETEVEKDFRSHVILAKAKLAKPTNVTTVDNYACVAIKKGDKKMEANVQVDYYIDMSFVKNETYAHINDTTLEAVCTAMGYPIRDIEIIVRQAGEGYFGRIFTILGNLTLEHDFERHTAKATGFLEDLDSFEEYHVDCYGTAKDGQLVTSLHIEQNDDFPLY